MASADGFSLVEVLVSIVLLGTAGIAVLGAVAASARGASTHRQLADTQTVIAAASETLMGIQPLACGAASTEQYRQDVIARASTLNLGGSWTAAAFAANASIIQITSVTEWDSTTNTFKPCPAGDYGPPQLVSVKVASPDGTVSKTIQVITGSPTNNVPIGDPFAWNGDEFNVFSEGDVAIAGGQIYAGLAVGGDLRWTGAGSVSSTAFTADYFYGGYSARLIVQGKARFDLSAGTLQVNNGSAIIGDSSNGKQTTFGSGSPCWVTSASSSCTGVQIRLQDPTPSSVAFFVARPIDFVASYNTFRAASSGMANLPGTCASAAPAVLRNDTDIAPWAGSGNFTLKLSANKVNVLNTTVAQLATMGSMAGGSSAASQTQPLIINVTDSGAVSFSPPNFTTTFPKWVIWNFPNATTLTFSGTLGGSLMAPNAAVTLAANVSGAVVAKSVVDNTGAADWNFKPDVVTDCTRTG